MKKAFTIISITTALVLGSCSDDFLNIPPEDSLSKPIFFQTQEDFEQAINAAYAPLRDLHEVQGEGAWAMGEMRSDNSHYRHNSNFRAVQDGENVANFLPNDANGIPENKYITNYLIIARVNQVLELIDAADFDASAKENLKGQALFLRGLSYFDLVQYFGAVPLHLIPVTSREEAALELSAPEEIYQQVIADVSEAISLLPVKSAQGVGRASQGSAQMLLANVYVVRENWTAAESVLSDLITSGEYDLEPTYAEVFDVNNENNSESIFEVQFLEGTEGFASSFMYEWIPMPLTAEQVAQISDVPNSQAAGAEGFNIPTPDIIESFEAGDERFTVSVDSIDVDGTYLPYINKFWSPHSLPGLTGVNWPVYRYAEALLFYAEVLNENGQTGQAEQYLNEVRDRAGLGPINGLGQAAMRAAILAERRVELAFENKRWLDLVRTGNVQNVMVPYGQRVKDNPADYYYPAGIAPPPAAFTTIEELFPLPASEALLNPNF
jgi:hypothetical protein